MKTPKRSLFLLLLDISAIYAAYVLARYIHADSFSASVHEPYFLNACILLPLVFYIGDLYHPYKFFGKARTFAEVVLSVAAGSILLAAAAFFDRSFVTSRMLFAYMAAALIPLICGIRIAYDLIFKTHMLDRKTVVIGTGPLALEIAEIIKKTPHSGMALAGFISEKKKTESKSLGGIPVIGTMNDLLSLIEWYNVQLVVLALDPKEDLSEVSVLSGIIQRQVSVTSGIHLLENITGEVPYQLLGSHYLLGLMSQVRMNSYLRIKRFIDLLVSFCLASLLFPLLAAAAVFLYLSGHRNIFFIQKRIGKDGRPFSLIKLRSMAVTKKGKVRVTRTGKWLRKYRIDEIPQLWNVLKGDMSLIGPRPEIPYFVERSRTKIPFYDAVFSVKPGLTGWAQIRFKHATTIKDYNQKFRYNLYYLKNLSLTMDFIILLKTVRVVAMGKGK